MTEEEKKPNFDSRDVSNIIGFGGCGCGLLIGIWPLIMAGGSTSEAGPGAALWLLPMFLIIGGVVGVIALTIANAIKRR